MNYNNFDASEDRMHGSMFIFLKRFVENKYDHSTWLTLLENAGIGNASYEMHQMYPTQEIFDIVGAAAVATGISAAELMESFGEFLVPDLLLVYKKYIDPAWKTYDMLLNTEGTMHKAVRTEDTRTSPPVLLVTKVGDKKLMIDYYSRRKMGAVAIGIIKGIAKYYNEQDKVTVTSLTAPHEERVQIAVTFQ
jgi:hypothetical protein